MWHDYADQRVVIADLKLLVSGGFPTSAGALARHLVALELVDHRLEVGTRGIGRVYAIVEKDGKREVKTILKGLYRPNGVVFHRGDLYVAELSRILRYRDIENNLDNPGKPEVVFDALPKDRRHFDPAWAPEWAA